jgi:hypothetical protein
MLKIYEKKHLPLLETSVKDILFIDCFDLNLHFLRFDQLL